MKTSKLKSPNYSRSLISPATNLVTLPSIQLPNEANNSSITNRIADRRHSGSKINSDYNTKSQLKNEYGASDNYRRHSSQLSASLKNKIKTNKMNDKSDISNISLVSINVSDIGGSLKNETIILKKELPDISNIHVKSVLDKSVHGHFKLSNNYKIYI